MDDYRLSSSPFQHYKLYACKGPGNEVKLYSVHICRYTNLLGNTLF